MVLEQLKNIIKEKQLKVNINDDILNVDFKELGLDSLDTFSVIVSLEEYFNVQLTDEVMMSLRTINDLVSAFENLINKEKK
ncbi:phosphopantetheine-binding protein [Mycoplasmoides alvi]|uniref:phosphopantetheine-binding protein n=1 Tax=Mycoplasmoides alvi TaxID=78580 RepID=UPI00146F9EAD|nr:phosphopantetheine-binding protein [Mycoplasmoides alvi]